ncbi:alpha/beta fold hydrolase [Leifsonia sp. TF02-11]|uniref:alpha/beta fold hydrolase n=1 Tax=Leifsonia sp. TF02-11 TaxID=2815212 RepID=UPI001AA0C3A3|nr:alpha/beta hydrolase [Leifsonia sp. TF02-11]MBO1741228.1 alpha/beta fold hydrolase [Leifsonia sp. TF02-11]
MPTTTLARQSFPAPSSTLPPVVLLHGFAASGEEDFVATGWPEDLVAAGRSVEVVDLPGHGRSGAVAGDAATTAGVVAALAGVLAELDAGVGVDVVGYSLGARLAWELPGATGRVRRLVLGGLSPFEPFAAVDVAAVGRAAARAAGEADAGSGLAADGAADPLVGMMAAMVSAPGRDTASLLALMAGLGSQPFDPAAGVPAVPTLVAAGADDVMTSGLGAVAATLPDAVFVRVPGDHRGALDSAEFRDAAIRFLA